MTSALSIRANECDYLVDGVNSCYLKGSNLYLFDGTSETKIEAGKDGKDGVDGQDGKSAFEVWVDEQPERQEPYSVAEYLAAIKGDKGEQGETGPQGIQGETGPQGEQGEKGDKGDKGDRGNDGADGIDGKSAFEVWCDEQPIRYEQDGCTIIPYTMAEYLAAITGPKGDKGDKGDKGEKGDDSKNNWLDWLNLAFNAGELGALGASVYALEGQIATLQSQIALIQGQIAGILGTTSVGNNVDQAIDVMDEFDEVSAVGQEGRGFMDSLNDWFSSFRSRIAGQTNRYTQMVNDYTVPELQSVSNAQNLVDIDLLRL